jgi:hypothetical protein
VLSGERGEMLFGRARQRVEHSQHLEVGGDAPDYGADLGAYTIDINPRRLTEGRPQVGVARANAAAQCD